MATNCVQHEDGWERQQCAGPLTLHGLRPVEDKALVYPSFFVASHDDILRQVLSFWHYLALESDLGWELEAVHRTIT